MHGRRLRVARPPGLLSWPLLALSACATPAILTPNAEPSVVLPRPCSETGGRGDAGPPRALLATGERGTMCCPAGYAMGGAGVSSCHPQECCPIWEGMGTPPPMPQAPSVGEGPPP